MKRGLLLGTLGVALASASYGAEYFTEYFSTNSFDMLGMSLTFTPDGSENYYSADVQSILELPVNPAIGTAIPLSDDGHSNYIEWTGKSFDFYGVSRGGCFIGSNGFLTLDTSREETGFPSHFSKPRISTFLDDWNPSAGGAVRYHIATDRFVVTFYRVPEFGSNGHYGTFQTELFFDDGRIRLSWTDMNLATISGTVGLSRGNGTGTYASDLSSFVFDFDEDGIWDEWEKLHFGHIDNCAATGNFDGDDLDNLSEYICGSDPKDSTSYFACSNTTASSEIVVTWPAVEGRTYRILKSENLGTPSFSSIQSGLEYPVNAFTDTVSSASGYYKVEVEVTD